MSDKLDNLIYSIRNLEIPAEPAPGGDLTLARLADRVATLTDWIAQALEEIRDEPAAIPMHGGNRHF